MRGKGEHGEKGARVWGGGDTGKIRRGKGRGGEGNEE